MKVEYDPTQPFRADTKEFHFPCMVSDACPTCGKEDQISFDDQVHLIRPGFNEPSKIGFYCWSCDLSWTQQIQLNLTVVAVSSPKEST